MSKPWQILIALTLARTAMGFQFQAVAAIGPLLTIDATVTHTELGLLIGAYLLPGAFLAIPGAWLGNRFGDKKIVLLGLGMMAMGGMLLALSGHFWTMFLGRLISGIGAILLNVLLSKMVTDWFAEHRLATAMGTLISSWPLGIAIALLIIGPLEETIGLVPTQFVPVLLCTIAFAIIAKLYSAPPEIVELNQEVPGIPKPHLSLHEFWGVVLSGLIWCFYNVALILPLSFGAEYLVSNGSTLIAASAIVSLTSWIIIPALPLGAWLTERLGHPILIMAISFTAISLLVFMIPFSTFHIALFALLGLVFGPAGGLIMALPAQVLSKHNRALGMGIFWTIYYIGMGIFPSIAGYIREITENPAAPMILAGIVILMALPALAGQRMILNRQRNRLSGI
jgi:MFS family permease